MYSALFGCLALARTRWKVPLASPRAWGWRRLCPRTQRYSGAWHLALAPARRKVRPTSPQAAAVFRGQLARPDLTLSLRHHPFPSRQQPFSISSISTMHPSVRPPQHPHPAPREPCPPSATPPRQLPPARSQINKHCLGTAHPPTMRRVPTVPSPHLSLAPAQMRRCAAKLGSRHGTISRKEPAQF